MCAACWSSCARTILAFSPCRAGAGPTATASGANTGPPSRYGSRRARPTEALREAADKLHFFILRQGLVRVVRSDAHLAARPDHQLSARSGPIQISVQHVGLSRSGTSSRSSTSIATSSTPTTSGPDIAAICLASAIPSCRTARRCSPIAGRAPTLSIDPASTGGKEWEEFLRAYNEFCSARGGQPLFNQTPFLTREQAQKAFAERLKLFADYRRQADPENRLLDSYFRDLLS